MKKITESEAKAMIIKQCKFIGNKWVIGLIDSDYRFYEVIITNLPESASKDEIKETAISELQDVVMRGKPNTKRVIYDDKSGYDINKTLG